MNSSGKKVTLRKPAVPAWRSRKLLVVVSLALASIVGTTLFAEVSRKKARNVSGEVSVMSLSASSPSKEYFYAGSRLLATETNYSISPTFQSFPGNGTNGGTAAITVTAPSDANWTAVSNNTSFINITSGSSGTGNGMINFSVATNPESTIRSGTITINSQTFTVYQGKTFADVSASHPFYIEIGRLSSRAVTLGCDASNYCPDLVVAQDQMAAFVIRALGMFNPPNPASQRFPDVNSSNAFYNFIEQMGARGIWTGGGTWSECPAGNYCPANPVRRDEMAAIVIRGLGEFNPPTPGSQRFSDVPSTNPYYNFVDRMAALQITLGCTSNQYCPNDGVTRGQMAAFLVRAFNL